MFDEEENQRRLHHHRKDPGEESFLHRLNRLLSKHGDSLLDLENDRYPSVFVFGLPRSGTTLLYQLLAYSTDLNYVNNLIARFWKAPEVGIQLSKAVLQDSQPPAFESMIGLTPGIRGAHEFGYFWADLLAYEDNTIKPHQEIEDVPREEVRNRVDRLSGAFGGPVVHKNLLYAFHLKSFGDLFPDSVFVRIRRAPLDVALSIIHTRKKRYGSKEHWWGSRPPETEAWDEFPYWEQVARQMAYMEDRYAAGSSSLRQDQYLEVGFGELVKDPRSVLSAVLDHLGEANIPVDVGTLPPETFGEPTDYAGDPDRTQMERALADHFKEAGPSAGLD